MIGWVDASSQRPDRCSYRVLIGGVAWRTEQQLGLLSSSSASPARSRKPALSTQSSDDMPASFTNARSSSRDRASMSATILIAFSRIGTWCLYEEPLIQDTRYKYRYILLLGRDGLGKGYIVLEQHSAKPFTMVCCLKPLPPAVARVRLAC